MSGRSDRASGIAYVRGRYGPVGEACVPILDYGFLRSDATYDVVHVWNGYFFRLEDHLDRFERSVERLHLTLPLDRARLRAVLEECVARSGLRNAWVAMICTRGWPEPGSRDPRRCRNQIYAFSLPFLWIADPKRQERGMELIVSTVQRIQPEAVDPRAKNFHWLDLVQGQYEAFERGAETAVLVDRYGNLTEAPGANIFLVKEGRLVTPERGVLEGITRRTVLEMAVELGIRAETGSVPAADVFNATEMFLTSTGGGVIPVRSIDGRPIGRHCPGPVTRALRDCYWRWHDDPRFTTKIAYPAQQEEL